LALICFSLMSNDYPCRLYYHLLSVFSLLLPPPPRSTLFPYTTLFRSGSIFISEGFAGLQKGRIQAADDIHIGYINQGFAQAGHSIHVENSIIHSTCIARQRVFCQQGNIIGGSLSAGQSLEAKDVGNRLSTKTEINLGINKAVDQKEQKLLQEKEDLQATLEKLELIGKKLRRKQHQQ